MMKRCNGSYRFEDLFKGRHFDGQIIILSVAWYTSFKLGLRDLVIMMADRAASPRPIQRFSGGSSATLQNSKSAGGAMLGHSCVDAGC